MLIIYKEINYPKLRGIIAEKNIKKDELAEIWHCSRQAVYNKINGKVNMTQAEARSFAEFAKLNESEEFTIFSTVDL